MIVDERQDVAVLADTAISAIVCSPEGAQLFVSPEDTAQCGKHL